MQVFSYDTVDSTNEAAKRLVAEGKIQGPAYVLAREQTAGRGTQGRLWVSPKDAGIYLSVVICEPGTAIRSTTMFSLAAGVACAEALADVAGVVVQLKPVNDLLAAGRKLGGILTEALIRGPTAHAVVTGVGINVRRVRRVLPSGQIRPTCLEDLMSSDRFTRLDTAALVEAVVGRIRSWNAHVICGDTECVRREWERHKVPGTVFSQA
jgi:BirA family biotin operon repressor/biotin-[acetyl-CoA-carboxylase] ligase